MAKVTYVFRIVVYYNTPGVLLDSYYTADAIDFKNMSVHETTRKKALARLKSLLRINAKKSSLVDAPDGYKQQGWNYVWYGEEKPEVYIWDNPKLLNYTIEIQNEN